MLNQFLNIFFFAAHTLLMAFNVFAWMHPRLRRAHWVCMGVTLFCWVALGAVYGWGYCPCTEWHFRIRREMGIHDGVSSYLQLLAKVFAGLPMSRWTSDVLAVGGLLFGIGGAVFSAVKARRRA